MLIRTIIWKVLDKSSWYHCLFPPCSLCPHLDLAISHSLFPSIAMPGRSVSYHGGASQGLVQSPGQESPIIWAKLKNLHMVTLECPLIMKVFRMLRRLQESVFLVSSQSLTKLEVIVYFPPYTPWRGPESSLLGVRLLGKGVDSILSHTWASFYSGNQQSVEKTPTVRKTLQTPLQQLWAHLN